MGATVSSSFSPRGRRRPSAVLLQPRRPLRARRNTHPPGPPSPFTPTALLAPALPKSKERPLLAPDRACQGRVFTLALAALEEKGLAPALAVPAAVGVATPAEEEGFLSLASLTLPNSSPGLVNMA